MHCGSVEYNRIKESRYGEIIREILEKVNCAGRFRGLQNLPDLV